MWSSLTTPRGLTVPEHYASANIGRLVGLANRVLDLVGTTTILRVASG